MFIDASAIVAILGREPGYEELEKRLAHIDGPFFVPPLVKIRGFSGSRAAEDKGEGREDEAVAGALETSSSGR